MKKLILLFLFCGLSWVSDTYAVSTVQGGAGSALTNVQDDTSPTLGGNLDANGFDISGISSASATTLDTPVLTILDNVDQVFGVNLVIGSDITGSNKTLTIVPGNANRQVTINANSILPPPLTDITGLGTGVATAAAINANATGGFVTTNGSAALTVARLKATAGSYTVTADGANTFSLKTCVGSDLAGTISITPSSTGNVSAAICTISGFNWASAPTIVFQGLNANALSNQGAGKALTVGNVTTTSFDLIGNVTGITSGTALTFTYAAFQ